ncbi:MAG: hypothetical protein ACYC42_12105, partial [Lysobacter sp.]
LLVFGQVALVGWLLVAELAAWLTVLVLVSGEPRPLAALRGLAVAPLRYLAMVADLAGVLGFMRERWQIRGRRRRLR